MRERLNANCTQPCGARLRRGSILFSGVGRTQVVSGPDSDTSARYCSSQVLAQTSQRLYNVPHLTAHARPEGISRSVCCTLTLLKDGDR